MSTTSTGLASRVLPAEPEPATRRPSISVVIPVYNGSRTLEPLVDRLGAVLEAHAHRFEIILVNDGSQDRSWEVVRRLAVEHDPVRGVNLMRNYGQHNALLCGLRAARYEITVTMDDDLQHPPEEIPHLLEELGERYDVVYGTPRQEQHGLWRDLASVITKIALKTAMGAENARNVSAFRAFRTQLRDAFANYHSPYVSVDVLLTWGSSRFSAVAVNHDPRTTGTSNYTFRKLVTHAVNMMTGFSTVPLQLASLAGFLLTLFGAATLVWVIGQYFVVGSVVPGFPFLASLLSIFSGAQLFALGILGEYMARVHFRTMDRPPYAVRALQEGAESDDPADRCT